MNTKEQKEYDAIKKRIALIDMEKAELLKKLRSNIKYAVVVIREEMDKMTGKFYATPNPDHIYRIDDGTLAHAVGSKQIEVIFDITKFKKDGQNEKGTYKIVTPVLPKDVVAWLNMGNRQLTLQEARVYIKDSLNAEKAALKARIREIDQLIKA